MISLVIQEHHYHVLECHEAAQNDSVIIVPDPDAPELPPPFKPDNSSTEPPPIYQEITEVSRDQKQHEKNNSL